MKKLFPIICALILGSCCYTFNLSVLSNYSSVYIPIGENNTTKTGLSETISETLEQELTSKYNFDITNNQSQADLTLTYSIDSHDEIAVSFTTADVVTSYRVVLNLSFTLTEQRGQVVAEEKIVAEALYDPRVETEDQGLAKTVTNGVERFLRNIENQW